MYEDFDIRIGTPRNGRYPLTAESVYGETKVVWQTLPTGDDFNYHFANLRDLIAKPEDAEALGQILREFLFPPAVWDLYSRSFATVRAEGKRGLRIRLHISLELPQLGWIPWEYCRDEEGFLALRLATPIVRYIPTSQPPEPIAIPNVVKILLIIANPNDQAMLDVVAEEKRIRDALAKLISKGRVELEVLSHATRQKLRQKFRNYDPHILHFAGHGVLQENGRGALVLENDDGQSQLADADDLVVLLQDSNVRLVILNACETAIAGGNEGIMGVAPMLVRAGIPAVVAMQFLVPDETAVAFMQELYQFLAVGKPLDAAVTEARIGTFFDSDDKVFWAIPVLFMRAPNGLIWRSNETLRLVTGETAPANLPVVYELLNTVFEDGSLDNLCLEYYPKTYDKFNSWMNKHVKLSLLLYDCQTTIGGINRLLLIVREIAEEAFKQFEPRLWFAAGQANLVSGGTSISNLSVLLAEINEWKVVHHEVQNLLSHLEGLMNELNLYVMHEPSLTSEPPGFTWKVLCLPRLKAIEDWNFQYAYTPEFNTVKGHILQVEAITRQMMGEINDEEFLKLRRWLNELKGTLWLVLVVADTRIKSLVERMRSVAGTQIL